MAGDFIKEFEENRIRPYDEVWASIPPPAHAGWSSFASQRSVRAVAVAEQSRHVWAATWGGVISWSQRDGDFYYQRYGSEHGLAGNAASCICLDTDERAWVGHDGGGLSYFEGGRWRVYEQGLDEPVRALCHSTEGVWVATRSAVYRIEGTNRSARLIESDRRETTHALTLLADDNGLLLGNAWGLCRVRSGGVMPVAAAQITHCTSLARDARGVVWVGTPSGVHTLAGEGVSEPFQGIEGRVHALAAGREGVWVATDSGLSLVTAGESPRVVSLPRSSASDGRSNAKHAVVRAVAAHPDESYLIAGTDDLLMRVTYAGGETLYEETPLNAHAQDELNNLCRGGVPQGDSRRVWVGTAGGLAGVGGDDQLTFMPERGDVWAMCLAGGATGAVGGRRREFCALAWPRQLVLSGRPTPTVKGLPLGVAEGLDGFAYVLTTEGLWLLAANVISVGGRPPERSNRLAQTSDGDWWAGTACGVYRLLQSEWVLSGEQPGPGSAEVFHVAAAGDALWAATDGGLWARRGGAWESHGAAEQAGGLRRRVHAVAAAGDGSGSLWLARADGVLRYDPNARRIERLYTPANSGLVSSRVNSLLEHEGFLWVFTEGGVSRLELAKEG
jgi:ligand-binding sensor domain-containing protein